MRLVRRWLAGGVWLVALAGCDSGGVGVTVPEAGAFQAAVQGSVATSYQGEGLFRLNPAGRTLPGVQLPPGVTLPGSFVLFSADPEVATREVQSFAMIRFGESLPAAGSYSLSALAPILSQPGFYAVYGRASAGESEEYVATSGEVRITSAMADRVQGSFHFHGVRVCSGSTAQLVCAVPLGVLGVIGGVSPPSIDVSGSFGARPAPQSVPTPFGL